MTARPKTSPSAPASMGMINVIGLDGNFSCEKAMQEKLIAKVKLINLDINCRKMWCMIAP
jgi:hypothetical protein